MSELPTVVRIEVRSPATGPIDTDAGDVDLRLELELGSLAGAGPAVVGIGQMLERRFPAQEGNTDA